jgi:hypothetical protein
MPNMEPSIRILKVQHDNGGKKFNKAHMVQK